jgi:hypothetical protein
MNRRLLFSVFAVLLLLISGSASAQDTEFPLLLWIRGDLYTVASETSAPVAITQDGTISGPVLAPSERVIAYKAASRVGLDALNRVTASDGAIAQFDLPGDIYLFDINGRVATQIAGQPADASLFVQGTPDKAIIRSAPVWSPDGGKLAWTQYTYPDGAPEIVVFNRVGGGEAIIARNIPAPLVQGFAPPLRWGSAGIVINASVDATSEQDYLFYGEDGMLLSSPRIAPVENDPVVDFVWVEADGGAQLGVIYSSARWILIDPVSGVARAAGDLPHLTTPHDESRSLGFGFDTTEGFYWELIGETAAGPGAPAQVTLSPSGQQVAFIGFPSSGAVSVWRDGNAVSIPNTGSNLDELQVGALLWGYTYWKLG